MACEILTAISVLDTASNRTAPVEFEGQVVCVAKEHSASLSNSAGKQSVEDPDLGLGLALPSLSARERRQLQHQQDDDHRLKEMDETNKENFPRCGGASEDHHPSVRGTLQHAEKKVLDRAENQDGDNQKPKRSKPSSGTRAKQRQDEMEKGTPSLADCRGSAETVIAKHAEETALKQGERCNRENNTSPVEAERETPDIAQDSSENSLMKLQSLGVDLCSAFLPNQEEGPSTQRSKEPTPQLGRNGLVDEGSSGEHYTIIAPIIDFKLMHQQRDSDEPISAFKSWQSELENGVEAHRSPGAGRLLHHIAEGDNPLISPRCSSFSKSQRFVLDTEAAPSPPSAQLFIMPRNSSLVNSEAENGPMLVTQLTKQIQNLRKKIRKYEEKFEQEKKYRPSHSDKVGDPEVLRWMNDLTRARKQLKELKLKISEEENNRRHRHRSSLLPVNSRQDKENKHHVTAESQQKPSVEETVQIMMKKLKEKQEILGLPEDVKVTKQERLLMKPLYDRYRTIKQLLSPAVAIPTIEEEGSDEETILKSCEMSSRPTADFPFQEFVDNVGHRDEDREPGFISAVDEKKETRQPTTSLSNLHEASMPELLEHLRETKADKKKLRKTLREFEEQFFKQTGRNIQKEDRTPMAEEYNEYKHIKAKLRLLEVLITKHDGSKTVLSS
ncbi:protein FAM13C isoform X2 [Heptranchias perlo]|uniref:protein FAM13C isoform X2 n=1 Tax=Heptranchias perlo TaxID=212740 RepID=UPI00355AADB5